MFPDMKSLQNLAVVFLDRDKLVYFNSVNNQIAVYNYPDKLIRFMEIINSKELEMQLKLFINYHKLPPAKLIFILSPQITFEKNFSEEKEVLQQNIIEDFLYHLPFENNVHKIYKLEKGFLISATNNDLLQVFIETFKKPGLPPSGCLCPAFFLSAFYPLPSVSRIKWLIHLDNKLKSIVAWK